MDNLESVVQIDPRKFYGTEYVINDLDQICPFMAFKLKRVEYCIIWRDTNFSKFQINNNQFNTFKSHLKDLVIIPKENYNIYRCLTSKRAKKLIIRKKYNKIILISNIEDNLEGKAFIDYVRKIIGNNVIVLFYAYNINHLNWIKDYKNALFTNEPKFFDEYLDCFNGKNVCETKKAILELKERIEKYYNNFNNVNNFVFNFDDSFLSYPYTEDKNIKYYSQLYFNDYY